MKNFWRNSKVRNVLGTAVETLMEAEATVEKLVFGGLGLLRHPELGVCFVDQVLPGERVRFRVAVGGRRRDFCWAELLEVLEPSVQRVQPRCVHYSACGACDWQHIRYEAQIELKQQIVQENLERFTGKDYSALQRASITEPSGGWAYRQRAKFFWQEKSKYYGFCQRSSNEPVPVPECLVIDPKIRGAISMLSQHRGMELYAFAGEQDCIFGTEEFLYRWNGLEFRSQALLFFQSNSKVLPLLLDELQRNLVSILGAWDGAFFDLYAGIGLFALCLGSLLPQGRDCFAVERNAAAFGYLQQNLKGHNFRCYQKNVETFLKQTCLEGSFIFADPSRGGLSHVVARQLNTGGAEYIMYLSCDAASFARDIGRLCHHAGSYELEYWYLVDFFPQTHHIETLALLKKKG